MHFVAGKNGDLSHSPSFSSPPTLLLDVLLNDVHVSNKNCRPCHNIHVYFITILSKKSEHMHLLLLCDILIFKNLLNFFMHFFYSAKPLYYIFWKLSLTFELLFQTSVHNFQPIILLYRLGCTLYIHLKPIKIPNQRSHYVQTSLFR